MAGDVHVRVSQPLRDPSVDSAYQYSDDELGHKI